MSWTSDGVRRKRSGWAVVVRSSAGEERELKYRSRAQAKFFAAVIALGPSHLPESPKRRVVRVLKSLPPEAAIAPAGSCGD